ncbi:MAG: DUF4440 domain-containing protein [Bryobacteraceae bacterium]
MSRPVLIVIFGSRAEERECSDMEELIEIEKKLWTNDAKYYEGTLTKDALLVFAETGVITRETAVAAILIENAEGRRWAEVHFYDVRNVRLADDIALLNYRVAARWENETALTLALATSIYVQGEGRWKLTFHQQTPMAAS